MKVSDIAHILQIHIEKTCYTSGIHSASIIMSTSL